MTRRLLIGAVALAVLVADLVVVATHGSEAPHWDARVLPLVDFVQEQRGLSFKHAVPVEFLDDGAFDKQVAPDRKESAEDRKDLQQAVGELRALGLVRGDLDLRKAEADLEKSSVIGLYVPAKKRVFVRGRELTPAVRVVLAHELTHALQDQYFDLTRIREHAFGGDATAVTALIEGDAVRIQDTYVTSMSKADQATYRGQLLDGQRRAKATSDTLPQVLTDVLSFPYAFGPAFLAELEQSGGNGRVDAAFRHPPSEEAQVFDPAGHPYDEDAKTLPAPALPSGASRIGKPGPFGQVTLFEVLSTALTYQQAFDAVHGWTADTSQNYTLGGKSCVAVDLQADGVLPAAQAWARTTHATVAQHGGTVSIRSCDPGATTAAVPVRHPSAFEVLEGRAAVITAFTQHGTPIDRSECIADGLVSRLGPARYGVLLATSLSPAETATVHEIATAAVQACL